LDTFSISPSARPASSARAGTGHHFRRGLFHRRHRFVGIGLNGLHQRFDSLGRVRGAFCETLHFVGHDRESATCFTGRGRLNGGVQRQNVGLLGDVVDQFHDGSDFLRAFTQSLDALRCFLDLVADRVHALDGLAHHFRALRGDLHRALRHVGRFGGVLRHLVDRHRNFVDRRRGGGDLLRLMLRGFGQMHRRRLGFLRGGGHLHGGFVNGRNEGAQRLDREVDRVRDRAGDVFGHRRSDRQVAFRERSHFVEQAQNGFLVALVQFLRDARSA
jgi:hypothetical protein